MPAYRIQTPRLILRCYSPADAPHLSAAIVASLDHLRPWMPWVRHEPEDLKKKARRLGRFRARFEQGRDCMYGMFDLDEREVVGGIGLHRRVGAGAGEIGYWVRADRTGLGLCTEAAAAVVRVGFEVEKLVRIEIQCDPANTPSAAIPRKLGFTHQVTVPGRVASPSADPRDTMIWTLLADAYPSTPSARAEIEAVDATGDRVLPCP